jgi:hypothetical protein
MVHSRKKLLTKIEEKEYMDGFKQGLLGKNPPLKKFWDSHYYLKGNEDGKIERAMREEKKEESDRKQIFKELDLLSKKVK